jgi:hypothetical protein
MEPSFVVDEPSLCDPLELPAFRILAYDHGVELRTVSVGWDHSAQPAKTLIDMIRKQYSAEMVPVTNYIMCFPFDPHLYVASHKCTIDDIAAAVENGSKNFPEDKFLTREW